MTDELKLIIDSANEQMSKSISHLEQELAKIRAGKANPQMLEGVSVDYYGSKTALSGVASVSTPDPRTIVIQPWEKSMITPIEKAIQAANLGFNPQNDGLLIRIIVPPLTEDRRKDLVKRAKAEAEHAKVSLRNIRKEANDDIKKAHKDGTPEDLCKTSETKIQDITNTFSAKIDKHLEIKEKEIMTV
jgi:ribosome recycling factor